MRDHVLKCWPGPYAAMLAGEKLFEWRRDDRGYELGDRLAVFEWDPSTAKYTGHGSYWIVTYILRGRFAVPDGYCVMGLRRQSEAKANPADHGIPRGMVQR
jgi:hypothetical protein